MPDFEFVSRWNNTNTPGNFYSNFVSILLSVDSVISVIVKTIFVLMPFFDIEKVCRTKYSPKNKYFFASFNNNRGLSLDNKTKDYADRNTGGHVNSLHEVTQLG